MLRLSGKSNDQFTAQISSQRSIINHLLGLLKEDDNGRTDLGTLEKRLAETQQAQRESLAPTSGPTSPRSQSSPKEVNGSTPHSSHVASPEPREPPKQNGTSEKRPSTSDDEDKGPEVEELSDMMCSLVTNNCGETRYIGTEARVQENRMLC